VAKWEYISESVTVGFGATSELQERLNHRGGEGWELVHLSPSGGSLSHSSYHLVFKRQVEAKRRVGAKKG